MPSTNSTTVTRFELPRSSHERFVATREEYVPGTSDSLTPELAHSSLPMRRRFRLLLLVVAGVALAGALAVGIANAVVLSGGDGSVERVRDAPKAQVALVLGAGLRPDGELSAMLRDRVRVGAELYRAGKVEKVLASGDHGRVGYDEVNAMKRELVAAGVPARDVFTDHAGFDTLDSVVRAKKVFQARSALIVTQGFHLPRAVWLAHEAGLDAHGVSADLTSYGGATRVASVREVVARTKAVADVVTGADPHFLGTPVPLTGDASASRG